MSFIDVAREAEIRTLDELVAVVGEPIERVRNKVRSRLHGLDRQWLATSPFCVLATSDAEGNLDTSPKGDPAGQLVHVLDDTTLAIAERPGNKRVDGYKNVLANPHVGLLFLIPGRDDTLRVNGRARLVSDAPWFDAMAVKGSRPILALVVEVDEIFTHCAKAFLRAQLWHPETWDPADVPSRAVISHTFERADQPLGEVEQHYGPTYAEQLY
ncbi:MAG: pyridoxamine 5'-phosphate oxidase family protein [Janthinobacterium lividum]